MNFEGFFFLLLIFSTKVMYKLLISPICILPFCKEISSAGMSDLATLTVKITDLVCVHVIYRIGLCFVDLIYIDILKTSYR